MKTNKSILLAPAENGSGGGPGGAASAGTPAQNNAQPNGISKADLDAAVASAIAAVEAKFTGQIAALTKEKEALSASVAEITKQKEALQGQVDAFAAANKQGGLDVNKLVEEITAKVSSQYSKSYSEQITQLNSRLQTYEEQSRKMTIEQYRNKAITDAGGPDALIVELVQGTTEDEINQSITKAKEALARVQQRLGVASNNGQTPNNSNGSSPLPVINPMTQRPIATNGSGSGIPNVRGMPLKDYAAQREALRRGAAQRYAGQ